MRVIGLKNFWGKVSSNVLLSVLVLKPSKLNLVGKKLISAGLIQIHRIS